MMYRDKMVAVVSVGGRILRERDVCGDGASVFLPFGSEYSLRFKNLHARRALLKVSIDGQSVLGDHEGIIIDANSELSLERFLENMDKGNRFRFIQKTKQIADCRGDKLDDGIVRIEWQYEAIPKPVPRPNSGFLRSNNVFFSNNLSDNATFGGSVGSGLSKQSFSAIHDGMASMDCCFMDQSYDREIKTSADLNIPLADEGITVKGSVSDQRFSYGHIGALEPEKHVITMKLNGTNESLQTVSEPLTVKTKVKCPTCGTANKSNQNFCGKCGTALAASIGG